MLLGLIEILNFFDLFYLSLWKITIAGSSILIKGRLICLFLGLAYESFVLNIGEILAGFMMGGFGSLLKFELLGGFLD
jgi:hypothetical protein